MKNLRNNSKLLILLFIIFAIQTRAYATWSIIAVDRTTRQIGIASASCTWDVRGVGVCVPGKGIVVVQAKSNSEPRQLGIEMLLNGYSPEKIIEAMRDEKFNPEEQQYAVISLEEGTTPAFYHGKNIWKWNGHKTSNDFIIIGNTLPDENVVLAAFEAFNTTEKQPLAFRLMTALKAGAEAGGDKRCGMQRARSAYITVAKLKNSEAVTYLDLSVVGMNPGETSAVELLSDLFENWKKNYREMKNRSTKISIVPKWYKKQ